MKSYYRVMIAAMAALLLAGCAGRPDSGSIFAEAEAITALPVQVPAAAPVSTETPIPEMTEAPAGAAQGYRKTKGGKDGSPGGAQGNGGAGTAEGKFQHEL